MFAGTPARAALGGPRRTAAARALGGPGGDAASLPSSRTAGSTRTWAPAPPAPSPALDPASPALILYTSGSTGRPRGVVQTFRNLDANTRSIVQYLRLAESDRALVVLPLYYCYGRSVLQTHLFAGGSVFLETRTAFPRVVLEALAAEGCTGIAGVPLTFEIIRRQVDVSSIAFPALRYLTQAGGAMAPETIAWVREKFSPARLFVMYGQTEATARLSYLPPESAEEKKGSIGIAIPGVELRVVDEQGRELPRGEIGNLVARGENVTPGYLDEPEETAAILRDGWLWTGDLALRDADGFFFHRGRSKEILKIGGHRVSPIEIEHVVAEHPGVAEAAVIGVAHEIMGEVPSAFVVASRRGDAVRGRPAPVLPRAHAGVQGAGPVHVRGRAAPERGGEAAPFGPGRAWAWWVAPVTRPDLDPVNVEGDTVETQRRYLLVSPCRDEAKFIRRTLDSVAAQTVPPALWVVIDDGSTDETPRILEEYARRLPYLRVVRRTDRGQRSVGPGVIEAFYFGIANLDLDAFDYLCKLDMDLDLPPGYFEGLMDRMERDPRLGCSSGKPWFHHPDTGVLTPESIGDEMSVGASKFYRMECYREIGGFVRQVMWDGIDCHRSRMFGWNVESVDSESLRFLHLRPMGSSQKGILAGRVRNGFGQYFMGTSPVFLLASAVYRLPKHPPLTGSLAMLWGYFVGDEASASLRRPRVPAVPPDLPVEEPGHRQGRGRAEDDGVAGARVGCPPWPGATLD